jgi:hypothetical protein
VQFDRSIRFALVADMRLPMHDGQKPRPAATSSRAGSLELRSREHLRCLRSWA